MSNAHLFWRPNAARPAAAALSFVDRDRAGDEEATAVGSWNPNERLSLAQQRLRLPIFANRRELLYMVERYRTTVVVGHTGCGKTTQIPQYLHEAGWTAGGRVVGCTQPRRVAAVSVAQRVAEEMGEALGGTVGYAVRFDDCCSREATRLKFMTDGLLLTEFMSDPLLSRYSVLMVDEAHERSLTTDVLLGLLKKLLHARDDLRLIVASATVDALRFKEFFELRRDVLLFLTGQQETSVTIDGVVFVVDCGWTKQRQQNPSTLHEALVVASYHGLPAHNPPEMQRCSLAAVTLQLKALGIQNVLRFDFLSPPPPESLSRALELLFALGALTEAGELTQPIGDRMARLPLEPQLAAMLLAAEEEACVEEAAAVAALLSVQSVFTVSRAKELEAARAPFAVYEGDSVTLLNVHRRFLRQLKRHGSARAGSWCRRHRLNERAQLLRQLARLGVASCSAAERPDLDSALFDGIQPHSLTGTDGVRRAIVRGYFVSAAQVVTGGEYAATHTGAALSLNPNSALWRAPPEWIVFHETAFTAEKEYVLSATKIEREWLTELKGPSDFFEVVSQQRT
ncbi:hypothetical protein EMIHUDRAFT_210154 [Emiliania huxleyi CCMP1516]|uniref:RNA helicase n=2 Tax=Emiliania huxleyi TaxID=2903 RepID=A0A0D3J1Q4_EMIH1|nr:hypothetical protein EMIHUDRAFT_210154 [Emiliania huxleyi CCMP1516]EOD17439.1 hypothetical protein EMIHUDRAFT_210154 [Emiliania huxleyi CCMP1516]|eukprot:XP_005769868.1 hypothetical protein EMIHUDRAFT_210154 [Emiliania huxleyi CCMP1516]